MDMNKVFYTRKEDRNARWHIIDAEGKILGRIATDIAIKLMGKQKTTFAPHTGDGDYVVVTNAQKVVLSGDKMKQKLYQRVSGWIGGKKEFSAAYVHEKHPTRLVEHAVKRMLPKNVLGHQAMRRLRVYAGADHPHTSQFNA